MKIIAIDVGTSSMKSTLYDEKGRLEKVFSYEYYSEYPKEGYVEQDPTSWKDALDDVMSKMGQYCKQKGLIPQAIAVTSQRSSMIPVDQNGNHLYKAIMWQDKRTIAQCDRLIEQYGLDYFYNKTGLRTNPYFVLPKILWLRENEKEIYDKSYKFIGVQDYVVHLLSDQFVTDHSQACRTLLMNISKFDWDKDLLDLGGISAEKLPKLVEPGSKAGNLLEKYSKMFADNLQIPVILSGGDQQNAAVALGVLNQGTCEANTGTGSFVLSAVDKPYFDKDARVLCQASAIPGKWIMEAGVFNTGAIYRWFRNNFYKDYDQDSKVYAVMNQEALESKPGSKGITMIPHFQGSAAPYWNPLAKGVFFNLSLDHKRGDLTRSILEGVASELTTNIRLIEKLTGDIQMVSVAGGMTRADLFCEIQANLYNRKVVRNENAEATSLGAAMISMVSLGIYKDIFEAYQNMVDQNPDLFEPQEDLVDIYNKVYERKMVLYDAINFGDVYQAYSE